MNIRLLVHQFKNFQVLCRNYFTSLEIICWRYYSFKIMCWWSGVAWRVLKNHSLFFILWIIVKSSFCIIKLLYNFTFMSSFWAYDSSFSTRLIEILFNLVIYSYTISSRSTDNSFLTFNHHNV